MVVVRVIAVDGPAGAGKSTIARRVASKVGMPFLDTGAMYRGIAYAVLRDAVDQNDADAVGRLAGITELELEDDALWVDGTDVTLSIRSDDINAVVSVIAAHSLVRVEMREQQRLWINEHKGGVVEGRDIGTVVFPDAVLKVFLTASPDVRANRRLAQSGGDASAIASSIAHRDHLDSTRDDSPLATAVDSVVIDTSEMSIDEVVDMIATLFEVAEQTSLQA
ncbi:MAG: (d)CMP kinase [Ilumatobacteraceae bacterium]|nr:(d)CMP kinase [Ilumatobacteraceae bacterium]